MTVLNEHNLRSYIAENWTPTAAAGSDPWGDAILGIGKPSTSDGLTVTGPIFGKSASQDTSKSSSISTPTSSINSNTNVIGTAKPFGININNKTLMIGGAVVLLLILVMVIM